MKQVSTTWFYFNPAPNHTCIKIPLKYIERLWFLAILPYISTQTQTGSQFTFLLFPRLEMEQEILVSFGCKWSKKLWFLSALKWRQEALVSLWLFLNSFSWIEIEQEKGNCSLSQDSLGWKIEQGKESFSQLSLKCSWLDKEQDTSFFFFFFFACSILGWKWRQGARRRKISMQLIFCFDQNILAT